MNPTLASHFRRRHAIGAVAFSTILLLAACGGGGGGGHSVGDLSQGDVQADAANGSQLAGDGADTADNVFDTARIVAAASAQGQSGPAVDGVVVSCPGGGTATVSGSNAGSPYDGQFEPGSQYTIQFAQCRGRLDLAQLDGTVGVAVVAASQSGDTRSWQVDLSLQGLGVTLALGTATYTGQADLTRTVVTGDAGASTSTSLLTSPDLKLATAFNRRAGQFDLSNLSVTRTVEATDGVPTHSTLSGVQTLAGTAFGRTFSIRVATDGEIDYDASGTPVTGSWTAVHGHATVGVQLAAGVVTVTYDRNSDGTPERTWKFTLDQLLQSEG